MIFKEICSTYRWDQNRYIATSVKSEAGNTGNEEVL